MSNNDWTNRTAPEDHQLPGIEEEYPIAGWYNDHENRLGQTGIELSLKYFKGLIAQQPIDVPHNNGTTSDPGYIMAMMNLCIVQSHTAYYLTDRTGKIIAWSNVPKFEEDYKSKISYFCYAAEIEETKPLTPFVLSVKSTVAKRLGALLRQFRQQILATADEITGHHNPHYFFYVPLGANGRVFFPDASNPYTIAPPTAYWDTEIADLDVDKQRDAIGELAIPGYLFDHIQAHGMDEAKAWRKTMENRNNDNGSSSPPTPPQDPPISPPPTADEMELERQQQLERERQQSTPPPQGPPPPPPAPPMSEAQAVAHAHQNEAQPEPLLEPKEAEETFYSTVKNAIRNGLVSVKIINEYVEAAREVGWPQVLSQLQQDIAVAA